MILVFFFLIIVYNTEVNLHCLFQVGAYVLTEFVIRWVEEWEAFKPVANAGEIDSKSLDNLLLFIEQLYLFKVVDSALIYDLLHKIVEKQLIEKGVSKDLKF